MCDILHARHLKAYLRFDSVFNLTKVKKQQEKLLDIIHGLTKRVFISIIMFFNATKFNRISLTPYNQPKIINKGYQREKSDLRKEFRRG